MYTPERPVGILPVTQSATWIAGLKTPPEIWAMIETMMAIASPCASAIATRSPITGPAGHDDGARAEEDQREGPDELRDGGFADVVHVPLLGG